MAHTDLSNLPRKPAPGGNGLQMRKGDTVKLARPQGLVTCTISWKPGKDYDIGAEVLYVDGQTYSVSSIKASGIGKTPESPDGAVKHGGDVGRSAQGTGDNSETLTINLTPEIAAVAPWGYSAQLNGTGSFHLYGVTMKVEADGVVWASISAADASTDDSQYTLVPAIITNGPDGFTIAAVEMYSEPDNEHRPAFVNGTLTMNAGPRNKMKWRIG